jgi:pilus assembly protein CpaE
MSSIMQRKPKIVLIGCRAEGAAVAEDLAPIAHTLETQISAALGSNAVRSSKAEVAVLFLDHEPEAILKLTRELSSTSCSPVVVSSNRDPDNILRAMRAGARDFAYLEDGSADIRRAVRDLRATLSLVPAAPAPSTGKVISVFGCKGGSGATTIALNLAGALMRSNGEAPARVAVVDLDLEMGDVLVFLDLASKFDFHDVVANMHRLDSELLQQSLATHASGLRVLSQTDQLDDSQDLSPDDCGKVIGFLRDHFDFVIVDGLRDFRDLSLAALDRSDTILCTMTQDIPALKNASRCMTIFKRLRYSEAKVRVVINRYRNSGKLTADSVSDALGRPVDGTVCNDFPTVIESVNEGRLLNETDPSAKVTRAIHDLVPLVHELPQVPKRNGLFARWGMR